MEEGERAYMMEELQAIVARLSPARRASLLDYARYLASCEDQETPVDARAGTAEEGRRIAEDDAVLDDCRRRGYGGLLGRER